MAKLSALAYVSPRAATRRAGSHRRRQWPRDPPGGCRRGPGPPERPARWRAGAPAKPVRGPRRRTCRACVDLRRDDGGEDGLAVFDHGGGGFIAGGFDAENAHYSYLSAGSCDSRIRRSMGTPGAGATPRGVVQQARRLPDAALGGALQVEQHGACGMAGLQGPKRSS